MFNEKYCRSKFAGISDLEYAFMRDDTISDLDKLLMDFELHKDDVKKYFPQLYYCLLAVKDKHKTGYRLMKENK